MMKIALLLALASSPLRSYDATFVSCYDGDTCTFDVHFGMGVVFAKQKIRFCDINAPEIRPLITREEATRVKDFTVKAIKKANIVKLEVPQKRSCGIDECDKKGKYGRWLAYIIIDGENLNKILIKSGLVEHSKDTCL